MRPTVGTLSIGKTVWEVAIEKPKLVEPRLAEVLVAYNTARRSAALWMWKQRYHPL